MQESTFVLLRVNKRTTQYLKKEVEFEVGDHVVLSVSSPKGVMKFRVRDMRKLFSFLVIKKILSEKRYMGI